MHFEIVTSQLKADAVRCLKLIAENDDDVSAMQCSSVQFSALDCYCYQHKIITYPIPCTHLTRYNSIDTTAPLLPSPASLPPHPFELSAVICVVQGDSHRQLSLRRPRRAAGVAQRRRVQGRNHRARPSVRPIGLVLH